MAVTVTVIPIEWLHVAAYRIPTDFPESDGTLEWDSTTVVLVKSRGRGESRDRLYLRRCGNRDEKCLEKLGLDFETLDSGCCGMAGSFGFEKDTYEVSIQCGERVLLPAIRHASPETLIIADGYSCREQIAQTTNHRALHLAQEIQMAIRQAYEK